MMKACQLLVISVSLILSSCAQTGGQIGTSVDLCCPGDYNDYDDYGIATVDMPLFLRDYVVEEFEAAFAEKGLSRNDQINDLRVEMRYNHINLRQDQQDINPFVRVEMLTEELSYIAEIEIRMLETATRNPVWAGSISRIHHVTPGEYMHEGPARAEFGQAFRRMLENYPAPE